MFLHYMRKTGSWIIVGNWNSHRFTLLRTCLKLFPPSVRLNHPNDARNTELLVKAMNTVMDFLSFTGESPSDFANNRLPTLDCSIIVENGTILHSFFEKPMRSDRCLDADTSLSQTMIKSSGD